MSARRQDAIEAIQEAIDECSCSGADIDPPCRLCSVLRDAIDLLEGDDVIPPDGWSVVGEQTVEDGFKFRARAGDRIVTLRGPR